MLDPTEFTSAMRKTPTPVSIVTTGGEHGPHGATVSAVCSLSASPPAVLICLNKNSKILGMIEEHGVYCVNYAAEEHRDLALAFAGVPDHQAKRKFTPDGWIMDQTTSLPVPRTAVATFTCLHIQTIPFGTHRILIGKVEQVKRNDAAPLAYRDGDFRRIVDLG